MYEFLDRNQATPYLVFIRHFTGYYNIRAERWLGVGDGVFNVSVQKPADFSGVHLYKMKLDFVLDSHAEKLISNIVHVDMKVRVTVKMVEKLLN